jgi:hypothetical protein
MLFEPGQTKASVEHGLDDLTGRVGGSISQIHSNPARLTDSRYRGAGEGG